MRIQDLENLQKDLPFDIVDDLAIFMRNDPVFYRKTFFPAVINMQNAYDGGNKDRCIHCVRKMIKPALHQYCRKFQLPKRPDDLLTKEDQQRLIKKLYSEEISNIKKGIYK